MAELDLGPATGYAMLFQSYAILAIVPKTARKAQCYKGGYAYRGDANREVRLYLQSQNPPASPVKPFIDW